MAEDLSTRFLTTLGSHCKRGLLISDVDANRSNDQIPVFVDVQMMRIGTGRALVD